MQHIICTQVYFVMLLSTAVAAKVQSGVARVCKQAGRKFFTAKCAQQLHVQQADIFYLYITQIDILRQEYAIKLFERVS